MIFQALKVIFEDRLYIELCATRPEWKAINEFLIEAAQVTKTELVATNDVHYLTQDDQIAQEVLVCIGTNKALADETRYKLGADFYFKSPEKMQTLFKDVPQAIQSTLDIFDI